MRNLTIKQGTRGLTDDDFVNHCQTILKALTGNINFPATAPLLPDMEVNIDEYENLLAKSKSFDTSPRNTLTKNEKRKNLNHHLSKIFNTVKAQGITNIVILTSSGFPIEKTPEHIKSLLPCEGFIYITESAQGHCMLKVKKVKGAQSYLFQYTETLTPEKDNWVNAPCGDTRRKITGLTPGVRYTFRVCAIKGDKMGAWSNYITRYMS